MVGLVYSEPQASSTPAFAAWYTGLQSEVRWIDPDGTLVLLRDGTQPRVVHLYRGNTRVDLIAASRPSGTSQSGSVAPEAAAAMAEHCLAASDLVSHLARDENALNCQLESLNDALHWLGESDGAAATDLRIRTHVERASLKVRRRDIDGAIDDLELESLARSAAVTSSPSSSRYRCMSASLRLISRYRSTTARTAVPENDLAQLLGGERDDLLSMLEEQIRLCATERAWEEPLYSAGLALAKLLGSDRGDSSGALERFDASLVPMTSPSPAQVVKGSDDDGFLNAQIAMAEGPLGVRRSADQPGPAIDIPTPHPDADPNQASRLNIEYQQAPAAWHALPWLTRLRTRKPEPPTGI